MDAGVDPFAALFSTVALWLQGARERLPQILAGLVVLLLFLMVARLTRWLVRSTLRRHDPSLAQMVGTLAYVGLLGLGLMAAFWVMLPTFNFADIFASLGLTGLILGFALKDLIENFVAGLLILWRRPFRVGDQIIAGAYEGTVVEINFRSTVLKTYDGVKVYVPNGKAFTEPLENKTGYSERRTTVILGIDQGASIARAREVILRTLGQTEGVLADPPPEVFFDAIGDFSNNLHVRYWTRPPTRLSELTTKSEVTERLYGALVEAGISFPYPIQTVRLQQLQPADGAAAGAAARHDIG